MGCYGSRDKSTPDPNKPLPRIDVADLQSIEQERLSAPAALKGIEGLSLLEPSGQEIPLVQKDTSAGGGVSICYADKDLFGENESPGMASFLLFLHSLGIPCPTEPATDNTVAVDNILKADIVVCCITDNFLKEKRPQLEAMTALHSGKAFLPIFLVPPEALTETGWKMSDESHVLHHLKSRDVSLARGDRPIRSIASDAVLQLGRVLDASSAVHETLSPLLKEELKEETEKTLHDLFDLCHQQAQVLRWKQTWNTAGVVGTAHELRERTPDALKTTPTDLSEAVFARSKQLQVADLERESLAAIPLRATLDNVKTENALESLGVLLKIPVDEEKKDRGLNVIVVSGEEGAGKSLLLYQMWNQLWTEDGVVAFRVDMSQFRTQAADGFFMNEFLSNTFGFNVASIETLKTQPVCVLLDGLDELGANFPLFELNNFTTWTNATLVVATSSPLWLQQEARRAMDKPLQELHLMPFDSKQKEVFIQHFLEQHKQEWTIEQFKTALHQHRRLEELGTNPLLLSLVLGLLPFLDEKLSKAKKTVGEEVKEEKYPEIGAGDRLSAKALSNLSRHGLYRLYIENWFDQEIKRLCEEGKLEEVLQEQTQTRLLEFVRDVALAMFEQDSFVSTPKDVDKELCSYFDHFDCPLRCRAVNGSEKLCFRHPTFRSSLVGDCIIQELSEELVNIPQWKERLMNGWVKHLSLSLRVLTQFPDIISFVVDSIRVGALHNYTPTGDTKETEEPTSVDRALIDIVYASKNRKNRDCFVGSANALTLLNAAGMSFCGRDFSGILVGGVSGYPCKSPHADLAGALLLGTNLHDADLENVRLEGAQLIGADLTGANLRDVSLGELKILSNQGVGLTCIAHSDGKSFATGTSDNCIQIWSLVENCCSQKLTGHAGVITSIAFSPDGKLIVSTSEDKTVCVWRMENNECIATLAGHTDTVKAAAFSCDSLCVASASSDKTVRLWTLPTGECTKTLEHEEAATAISWSPFNKKLVSGSADCTVRIWDTETGECVSKLTGAVDAVTCVAWSADGKQIIAADCSIYMWDAATGALLHTIAGSTEPLTGLAWSSDEKWFVASSFDKTVRIWDRTEGSKLQRTLTGHVNVVTGVAVDQSTVLSCSLDGTIRIWPLQPLPSLKRLFGHTSRVESVALDPSNLWAVSGSDQEIRIWSLESGRCERTLHGHSGGVTCVAIDKQSGVVLSGSDDQTARVWSLETGECLNVLKGHKGWITSVTMSEDKKFVVTGCEDETMRLWDLGTGKCEQTLEGHTYWMKNVCLTPDGKDLVTPEDNDLKMLVLESGECKMTFQGHTDRVECVALSQDGKLVVSGGVDQTVRVWALESGQCVGTLVGHSACVTSVHVSEDCKLIISGSDDQTVRVWAYPSGKLLHVFTASLLCLQAAGAKLNDALISEELAGVFEVAGAIGSEPAVEVSSVDVEESYPEPFEPEPVEPQPTAEPAVQEEKVPSEEAPATQEPNAETAEETAVEAEAPVPATTEEEENKEKVEEVAEEKEAKEAEP